MKCTIKECKNKPGPGRIDNWEPDTIRILASGYTSDALEVFLCDYHDYLKNGYFIMDT